MDREKEARFNLPEREEKILEFWERNKIFEKSLEKTKKGKNFVFYEGPPTANGRPGVHHALTRAFKDAILRYKTMRGFFVPRKAGWDTHGLPVEIEVEKELGIKAKLEIERYGIAKFNQKAKESVWHYKDEWEKSTQRLGFWLDLERPYITYETTYIETLWWIVKQIWKKGLLYQDFKVIPWCPRCETGLSSHEVGLGYQKVKEDSIYVKLKIKGRKNEYLLVWTTTPWTLPANVVVAVNPQTEYTKYKINNELIWASTVPPYWSGDKVSVVEKAAGKTLVGWKYEALFQVPKEYSLGTEPEYAVIPGEFVSTADGTGMVHLAPAFGEEDMNTVKAQSPKPKAQNKKEINYPILQTVNTKGTMKKGIMGEGKFVKDADKLIIEDLKKRGLLYKLESHEHDYPFCWRCSTPLLYFARTAWWIRMSGLRTKLLANNEKINWIPEHIKHGRFGEFLKEVRDWAFSRERYWGTPLPIWECVKCEIRDVIGSRDELAEHAGPARNRYFIMRHGEAENNIKNLISSLAPEKSPRHLTLKGRRAVEGTARKIKNRGVDLIISSDFIRTKETAEIMAGVLGPKVIFDPRLREIKGLDGFPSKETEKYISDIRDRLTKKVPDGETIPEVRARILPVLLDLEKKYRDKTILLVGHEYPLWILYAAAGGLTDEEMFQLRKGKREEWFIHHAEVMEVLYKKLSRDERGEVNLHRPYVDSFEVECRKCRGTMRRVPEVIDVWFDSGSMPFAQAHFPFSAKKGNEKYQNIKIPKFQYPADFICEAVDQTRGWFYSLLAVATLLGKGTPYKNVISLGHVLDKNGQKMSKSKGNVVDPRDMISKYGADTLRWYFYTLNQPGDPKRFDEEELRGKLRGFLMTFWNCFLFFDTYVDKAKSQKPKVKSTNVLDRWVAARLRVLINEATERLDQYDITGAARMIEDFVINDFSQWYLRRSRRRFQHPVGVSELEQASATTAEILATLAKLLAPFAPSISEALHQELRKKVLTKESSVHLSEWPKRVSYRMEDDSMVKDMILVRGIVATALRLRASAGIKVRQPLQSLEINFPQLRNKPELLALIKDEINVKEITLGKELRLDTKITPELKEEGTVREIVRNLQEMRKDFGLRPKDKIRVQFSSVPEFDALLEKWKKMIMHEAGANRFVVGGKKQFRVERELEFDGKPLWVGVV